MRLIINEKDFFVWSWFFLVRVWDTRPLSNGKKVSLNKKHVYNTSPDVFTFCPQKIGNSSFWDEEFFKMSPYICQNFKLLILYNFQFHHMVWKRFPTVLKSFSIFVRKGGKWQKLNFWNEDFFGMCSYTLVRTFRMTCETFFNFFIWSKTPFLTFGTQKTRKIKFLERGVLWDEFLHM